MIRYSLNNGVRQKTTEILILLSLCITRGLENSSIKSIVNFVLNNEVFNAMFSSKVFELLVVVVIPPFFVWWLLNLIYSKWLWSYLQLIHNVPNLNGKWIGYTVNNQKPDVKRPVVVTIKQDWNHILIKTDIQDSNNSGSFCECTVAAVDVNGGEVKLKYAYKNGILENKSYIGYNELILEKNELSGVYITTKPTKGTFKISR